MPHPDQTPSPPAQDAIEDPIIPTRTKQLNQRVSNLANFELATCDETDTDEACHEDPPSSQDMHKIVDLFTHSLCGCPHRKHMTNYERVWHVPDQCIVCYDPSTTMDYQDWQPFRHKHIIKKFPELARKERRGRGQIWRGNTGSDNTHGEAGSSCLDHFYVSDTTDDDEEDTETDDDESPIALTRYRLVQGRKASSWNSSSDTSSNDSTVPDVEGDESIRPRAGHYDVLGAEPDCTE